MAAVLKDTAARALERMRARGFDAAQASFTATRQDEMSLLDNAPGLLRTTQERRLALVGIVEGRKSAAQTSDLSEGGLADCIEALFAAARAAPRDDANRVSAGQRARIVQGPQHSDLALLTAKAAEILEFLPRQAPKVMLREGVAAHTLTQCHTLTSAGADLETSIGHHTLSVFGVAREAGKVSSFQLAGGHCHEMPRHAAEYFGIGETLRDLERQIESRPFESKFVGDVVLTPAAVADFIGWLLGQLGDEPLIGGTSLYRGRVGQAVASRAITLRSRFDAPGVAAVSSDGFVAPPVTVVREGVLQALLPSLYASLKTNIAHVPTACGGWELAAGDVPREALTAGIARGALVGRLSMGKPAANGDFAGLIKNSFAIVDGKRGHALSETMIAGNVAKMLLDVVAVSRERLDTGAFLLPWLRVGGLHFS